MVHSTRRSHRWCSVGSTCCLASASRCFISPPWWVSPLSPRRSRLAWHRRRKCARAFGWRRVIWLGVLLASSSLLFPPFPPHVAMEFSLPQVVLCVAFPTAFNSFSASGQYSLGVWEPLKRSEKNVCVCVCVCVCVISPFSSSLFFIPPAPSLFRVVDRDRYHRRVLHSLWIRSIPCSGGKRLPSGGVGVAQSNLKFHK